MLWITTKDSITGESKNKLNSRADHVRNTSLGALRTDRCDLPTMGIWRELAYLLALEARASRFEAEGPHQFMPSSYMGYYSRLSIERTEFESPWGRQFNQQGRLRDCGQVSFQIVCDLAGIRFESKNNGVACGNSRKYCLIVSQVSTDQSTPPILKEVVHIADLYTNGKWPDC